MTTDRIFFGSNELTDAFVQQQGLQEAETLHQGWATRYEDPQTGHQWLQYFVEGVQPFSYHLMRYSPPPATGEIIERAFATPYPDEVIAAAGRLLIEEQYEGVEFRQQLLDRIQALDIASLSDPERERIRSLILFTDLAARGNRRQIVGKHIHEILQDAAFFRTTAARASELLHQL